MNSALIAFLVFIPRRPTDELRRQLSLTPSQTRRSSLTSVYSNGSVSKNTTTSTRKVSPQEVDEMLKNVLELARRNHITEGNVWKLTLIDHLKQLHRADGSVDFDKASAGLGAAIQIYSKRVDSALTQALDALNRMDMKVKDKMKGARLINGWRKMVWGSKTNCKVLLVVWFDPKGLQIS